jgi:PAT family beta-lactamase induction signal transducer AmpG
VTNPWGWVPTLYFGQGIPYVVVMTLSVVLYKNLGLSNTEIALYTSWLYLPWVIKPLWSPLVDLLGSRRQWIIGMQFLIGVTLALVALTLPTPFFVQLTLAVFWLMAFSSATHDIAADGFYLHALRQHQQAAFVGVRSAFYRAAMIAGQGGLVWLAGTLAARTGDVVRAWCTVMWLLAAVFLGLALYHRWALPVAPDDRPSGSRGAFWRAFVDTFVTFFRRRDIAVVLAFLLLFRFGEAQALKLVTPFLLDPPGKGGLGISTSQVGQVYGTLGVIALTLGGLAGGYAISRRGLKAWLWWMLAACHLPNLVFVALAFAQPTSLALIGAALVIEQFGYGFGFAAYLMFMIWVADAPKQGVAPAGAGGGEAGGGAHKTAHYALCTGFMALGMMLPGMVSGWLQEALGYRWFFVWVCVATLPSFFVAAFVRIDPAFGRKVGEA